MASWVRVSKHHSMTIQEHDSREDALAALQLYKWDWAGFDGVGEGPQQPPQ